MGSRFIDSADALSSRPSAPTVTLIFEKTGSSGTSSGVPPVRGSVIVMSPKRICVWVHEFRNPPARGGAALFRPPATKRSAIASVCIASKTEKGLPDAGSSRSMSPVSALPRSGCSGVVIDCPEREASVISANAAAAR